MPLQPVTPAKTKMLGLLRCEDEAGAHELNAPIAEAFTDIFIAQWVVEVANRGRGLSASVIPARRSLVPA
jgi:hypothetical protein